MLVAVRKAEVLAVQPTQVEGEAGVIITVRPNTAVSFNSENMLLSIPNAQRLLVELKQAIKANDC